VPQVDRFLLRVVGYFSLSAVGSGCEEAASQIRDFVYGLGAVGIARETDNSSATIAF
jgi:hypothetical protein